MLSNAWFAIKYGAAPFQGQLDCCHMEINDESEPVILSIGYKIGPMSIYALNTTLNTKPKLN